METYDVITIGTGPAGLTASIYASRYKLKNLIIGKTLGGELSLASKIENIPGFLSISGIEWGEKVKEQVEKLGANIIFKQVDKILKEEDKFVIVSDDIKERFIGKTLIVATGSERRRLKIPGEKEYQGKGVSFCTTCDATFFRDKTVALIGGSDSAVSGAVHTAEYAKKVYIIYRKDKLRAEPIWIEEWKRIEGVGKGETIYNTNITEIVGDGNRVTGVKLDSPYNNQEVLAADGVFIEIGGVPGTGLVKPLGVKLDQMGFVVVNEAMETGIPGLFCGGDIVDKSKVMQQAITAMAQGAIAAASCYKFLKKEKAPQIVGL